MKKCIFTAVALAIAPFNNGDGIAFAQDYSPYPEATIRTVRYKGDADGYLRVVVAVKNISSSPIDIMFECSLFDERSNPYAAVEGVVSAIPPGREVAGDTLTKEEKPTAVSCRITSLIPTR